MVEVQDVVVDEVGWGWWMRTPCAPSLPSIPFDTIPNRQVKKHFDATMNMRNDHNIHSQLAPEHTIPYAWVFTEREFIASLFTQVDNISRSNLICITPGVRYLSSWRTCFYYTNTPCAAQSIPSSIHPSHPPQPAISIRGRSLSDWASALTALVNMICITPEMGCGI